MLTGDSQLSIADAARAMSLIGLIDVFSGLRQTRTFSGDVRLLRAVSQLFLPDDRPPDADSRPLSPSAGRTSG
jgi:hypothetical protein